LFSPSVYQALVGKLHLSMEEVGEKHPCACLFCCPVLSLTVVCAAACKAVKDFFLGIYTCFAALFFVLCCCCFCSGREAKSLEEDVRRRTNKNRPKPDFLPMAFKLSDEKDFMRSFCVEVAFSVVNAGEVLTACKNGNHANVENFVAALLQPLIQEEALKYTAKDLRTLGGGNLVLGKGSSWVQALQPKGIRLMSVILDRNVEVGVPFGRDIDTSIYDALAKSDVAILECQKPGWFGFLPVPVALFYVDAKSPKPMIVSFGIVESKTPDSDDAMGVSSKDVVTGSATDPLKFKCSTGIHTWHEILSRCGIETKISITVAS